MEEMSRTDNRSNPSVQDDQATTSQNSKTQAKFSNGPHIRSRITVVCAECKRLKLKCDRRTPCSSCLKRDTTQRCVYSQAAAEKIDVQSLHNRLLAVEGTLAHLSSASPSTPISSAFAAPFKSSFPGAQPISASSFSNSGASQSTAVNGYTNMSHSVPFNDRALLAVGASGSSVVINLEDVASIWLSELDISLGDHGSSSNMSPSHSSKNKVKLEPSPVLLPPTPPASSPMAPLNSPGSSPPPPNHTFIPPLPYSVFLPSSSGNSPSSHVSEVPQVTRTLLSHLPSQPAFRARILRSFSETMVLHPSFNVKHFERRVEAMLGWGEGSSSSSFDSSSDALNLEAKRKELARDLFNLPSAAKKNRQAPKPTLSFFAAASAAFALGGLVISRQDTTRSTPGSPEDTTCNPSALIALSEQALEVFEKTSPYDLDSVNAMILQVLYRLHDGQMHVGQGVFPLVGKMVNIARMMGLAIDPDEFPGTYNLFEAEARRRVWWDVFYYDLFISDCMGHPPLIPDNSFTTKLPADVDEEKFTPSSTILPLVPENSESESSFTYFILKCRLAQLVKSVKKQTFRDPLSDDISDFSNEQAASFECDISTWLSELPQRFRLDGVIDLSRTQDTSSVSSTLLAQRCELAIVANRMILKLHLPSLKEVGTMVGPNKPVHAASLGTINATHAIIHASRLLHSVWKSSRPASFDFYDFGRTLFDAAVVCAHMVIQQPGSILSAEAMKGVTVALDVMKSLGASTVASVEGADGKSTRNSEAIKIVEMMMRKAEQARMNGSGSEEGQSSNGKRKRADGSHWDDSSPTLDPGFQLPFVGVSVSSAANEKLRPTIPLPKPAAIAPAPPKDDSQQKAKSDNTTTKHKEKQDKEQEQPREKEKRDRSKYPSVGIRARTLTNQGRPSKTQRIGSVSPPPTPVQPSSMIVPSRTVTVLPAQQPAATHNQPQQNTVNAPPPEPPVGMYAYAPPQQQQQQQQHLHTPPSQNMDPSPRQQQQHMQQDHYVSQRDAGRYSQSQVYSNTTTPPQTTPGYVEQPSSTSSFASSPDFSTSYNQPPQPSHQEYYTSYAPAAPPQAAYEVPNMGHHSHDIAMTDYSMQHTPVESVPSTPLEPSYMMNPKAQATAYSSRIAPKTEPSITHHYQQPTGGQPQQVTMTGNHIQGWTQANPSIWPEYKFYNG